MAEHHGVACPACGPRRSWSGGFVTGIAMAATALLGSRALAQSRVGRGHSVKHRALDFASSVLQRKHPLDAMSSYLNGFHFYADDMGRQVEAHHFCTHLEHDLHQCVIYDSNKPGARLIGIEYIISAERFASLPDDEKKLWHSHHYEVASGTLIAPGVPQAAEHALMRDLASTYGKTWHTWQIDRDPFPMGIPRLMMGFTADGQVDSELVARRDRRIGVSSMQRRRQRADIDPPIPMKGANSWESGEVRQLRLSSEAVRGLHGAASAR